MNQFVKLNNLTIEYIEIGNPKDETIIFAHGLGTSCEQWRNQLKNFDGFHVIALSLQGHGHSEKPLDESAYSIKSYLDTYSEFIKQFNIKKCIWVGNSMGGVLGYGMMKRFPNLIKQLITNGTTPKLIMPKVTLKMMGLADKLLIKLMTFDRYIKFAANHSTKYESSKNQIYEFFKLTTPQTITTSHQLLGCYDYLDQLASNYTNITIIKSPDDKDINKYLKKYQEELNESRVTIIDFKDTGHICNIEKPILYNQLILKIINDSIG